MQENIYNISPDPIADVDGYIAGHLVSALLLEDKVSRDVYKVYLEREVWPASLPEETFQQIRSLIYTLIDQTERHRNAFHALQKKLQ